MDRYVFIIAFAFLLNIPIKKIKGAIFLGNGLIYIPGYKKPAITGKTGRN
jgi:hypothetical protein